MHIQLGTLYIMHTLVMPYLCVVCVGQVNSDHSGSKSPVREVHHLGLLKDRKSTKNVVARRIDIKT